MLRNLLILTLIVFTNCKTTKFSPDEAVEKLGPKPYIEIDGQPVNRTEFNNFSPTEAASATVYYGNNAIMKFGEKAKDGAVIIESKALAIIKYETLFRAFSKDY